MLKACGLIYWFTTRFSKVFCCKGVRRCLYMGKDYQIRGLMSKFSCFNNRCCINPFPHTTILQQTTLNIFCKKIENLYNWMDNLWLKLENIVAKEEIARLEQFLLLSLCFQNSVCCSGVYMREMAEVYIFLSRYI